MNDDDDTTGNPEDLEEADMIEAKVPAGKKLKLEYQVDQPKTQICWSFQTDDREIGFTVYFGEKEETLVPYGEFDYLHGSKFIVNLFENAEKFGSLSLQNSSLTCEKPGKCNLIISLCSKLYLS